ncbi:hypothetical protein JW964_28570 [candidate division KSB1 bacterium]|nr:hypothetical protein [candidate division KSB1 bacterium]
MVRILNSVHPVLSFPHAFGGNPFILTTPGYPKSLSPNVVIGEAFGHDRL